MMRPAGHEKEVLLFLDTEGFVEEKEKEKKERAAN